MENLFAASTTENILSRIDKLHAGIIPVWGKMNVAQMLAHCQMPIKVGIGDAIIKRSFIGFLFGRMAKKFFLKDKPFPKSLPTDKSFIMANEKLFEEEKQKLIDIIRRFSSSGAAAFSNTTHPFFGKMSPGEWGILSWKHLDHHLQQFGV